jgi:hypothetical protein
LFEQIKNSKINNFYYPTNLPLDNTMNITFSRLGMKLELKKKQIDDMIFAGFESMMEYMDERYNNYIEELNLRTIDL